MEALMPSETRLGVEQEVADEVRGQRRHVAAIEQRDVTLSQFLRLALAMLRAFISDPQADAVVSEWRAGLAGKAAPHGQ
jgi:hypothetical protein